MHCIEQLEDRRLFASYTAASVTELIATITRANGSREADTIALAAGTTFSLAAVDNTTDGATGLPVIATNSGGLTILGSGASIERSTATGTPAFRLFNVAAGASLTLSNVTVRGGLISATGLSFEPAQGGGIYSRGSLNLVGATVESNTASGWMPVYNSLAVPAGPAEGGGIFSGGTLTITDSVIQNNVVVGGRGSNSYFMKGFFNYRAVPGADGSGGGIYVAGGVASISGAVIRSNTARGGFGGSLSGTTLTGGNGYGGGVYAAGGTLTLRNSRLTDNAAIGGSGLVRKGNSIAPGNEGNGIGGGIYINGAASTGLDAFTAKNTTRNTASSGSRDIFGRYTTIT